MPESPLHLGWQLESPKADTTIIAKGMRAHSALIAQSGSGKSFTLGRLLEEITSKTAARVVVFDPNSDFVKFSEIESDAWAEPDFDFASGDTIGEFRRRWSQLGFNILTNRPRQSLSLSHNNADVAPLTLSWGPLHAFRKGEHLGLSPNTDSEELLTVFKIHAFAEDEAGQDHHHVLQRFIELARQLSSESENSIANSRLGEQLGNISRSAALNVYVRAAALSHMHIWDHGSDVTQTVRTKLLGSFKTDKRFTCLDLGSLGSADAQHSISAAALDALWDYARQEWFRAMANSAKFDSRVPIFLVLDEAHNLAPPDPETPLLTSVTQRLIRIATEGRKYGLFLILVTQRPSRLHQGVLSQCDNLCVLKMNNRLDVELLQDGFGFLPPNSVSRAMDFDVGDAILAGAFVGKLEFTHGYARRTVEGGRNIGKGWLSDPIQ